MQLKKVITLIFCVSAISIVSACSETRYAAHVVKQIPFPGDPPETVGSFKVGNPYNIKGRNYYPRETYNHSETGIASWYGPNFHGKKTANGEIFDKNELTAAHRTLQMPSIIRVTNLSNGRSIILRVNDRGPFAHDRILDVSERAATVLGFKNHGTAKIRIDVLSDASVQVAEAAKQGYDTRGYEVSLNNKGQRTVPTVTMPQVKPEPVTQVAISAPPPPPQSPYYNAAPPPTHTIAANGQPVPLQKPMPVQAEPLTPARVSYAIPNAQANRSYVTGSNVGNLGTGKIYVQAGSFSQEQNALSYSNNLSGFGPSKVYMTHVNNRPFFRVRLGPYDDRIQAQQILTALNEGGNKNAVIVVD